MMKSKEEKGGFAQGMGTMLIASIGTDLFGRGGWMTYLGLALMIGASISVYRYIRKS